MKKIIYNKDTFNSTTAMVGDLVEEQVVDNFMNCLPPASFSASCAQLGDPYSHRQDELTGKWRATFLTFRKADRGVWEYCGKCFRGETEERGKEAQYVV